MIYDQLFDWQKNIVDKYKTRLSYGLFLDMGLGKTVLSLGFAEVNQCTKILVVTINAKAEETEKIKGSWLWWASKSNIKYNLYNKKAAKTEKEYRGASIVVLNYESLYSRNSDKKSKVTLQPYISAFINSCKGENVALIIDESHKMKDLQSLQTLAIFKIKSLLEINSQNLYSYLLSGTPFTTGYIDLYSQLKLLGWEQNKSYFKDNFCKMGNIKGLLGWQQPIVGYKNLDELYKIVHRFGITLLSEDVLELPEKVFVDHELPLTAPFDLYTHDKVISRK